MQDLQKGVYILKFGQAGVKNGRFEGVKMGFWAFWANSSPILAQTDLETTDTDGKQLEIGQKTYISTKLVCRGSEMVL